MGQDKTVSKPWSNPRLSPDVQPELYNLHLHPNLRTGTFKGKLTVIISVKSEQPHIAVHIKGLNITKTELTVGNETRTKVNLVETFEFEPNEFWVIVPENDINPGSYKLYLEFDGKLTNKIVGFYQSVYKNAEEEERRIATTKFEPTFARQAFPCFDEPSFKARYNIELVKPSSNNYIALSNMNVINQELHSDTNWTTVKFSTSFPMSTYLACFIVCDFEHLEPVLTTKGFPITVYARKEHVKNVKYARDVALTATNFYINYFNIDYPLPKLDLIAIPDFVSGAMENWGLITFRETRLLCVNEGFSVANMLAVALTVCHEIAHMWFGDLVTMKWWNDLWLNEGFATFAEYKAAAQVHPDWEIENMFAIHELFPVLRLDSTLNSHPIVQPVSHPDQITEIFDSISYNKGASVIRMLEATIGEENFRKGITAYMNKFKYSNAETQDLWNHLNEFSGDVNVSNFMDTWTKQMGFPLISVKLDDKSITFSQQRHLYDSTAKFDISDSPYNYRWEVPITFITSENPTIVHKIWMKRTDDQVVFPLSSKIDWVKVNFRSLGYYMVNYEPAVWDKLKTLLETNYRVLDPIDRSNLLNEAFFLAESGCLSYDTALKLTKYLSTETHYAPWLVTFSAFQTLEKKLYATDAYKPYLNYLNSLVKNLRIMSWDYSDSGRSYPARTFQNTILHLGCMAYHTTCLNQANTLFRQWLSIPAMKLNPELVQIVMYYGVQQTGNKEWEELWNLYLKEENPQDKVRMMKALCATKNPTLITKYLQLGKNESFVRSQDYLTLIAMAAQNPTAAPIVWDFVRNEWPYLVKRYTLNDRYLGKLIEEVTHNFASESRLAQLKEFYEKYPEAGAGTAARKRAKENIENNLKWRQTHLPLLTEWFKNAV